MVFYYSLHENADPEKHKPFRKHDNDAGWDLPAFLPDGPVTIPAKGNVVIPTAIITHFPDSYVGLIRSRSGLAVKHSIEIGAGVIDSGWASELAIKLYNHGDEDYVIEDSMRIAQILFVPIYGGPIQLKQETEFIRGTQGFGSTGY
jgi:deoxyuridine 5'-triphosphate nucleotidohydrolase